MTKSFKELTEVEVLKFASLNSLPTSLGKRSFLEREYIKALKRGVITDPKMKSSMLMAKIPLLAECHNKH